jgi:hypothetical protein
MGRYLCQLPPLRSGKVDVRAGIFGAGRHGMNYTQVVSCGHDAADLGTSKDEQPKTHSPTC